MSSSSMATPSITLNSNTHNNTTLNEDKDLKQHQQPSTNVCIKAEPENEHNLGVDLTKSVNELSNLAVAIQTFKSRYDELQKHLDFIEHAIDAKSKELTTSQASSSGVVPSSQLATAGDGVGVVAQPVTENDGKSLDSSWIIPKSEGNENVNENENENEDEIVTLCKTMNSRGVRRYIISNLSEAAGMLREQVPAALKSAPKPAKLVFECIGRFFLQGSKAYTRNSPMIPAREASVLVLEYYLMSGRVESERELEASLKKEAASAAVAWRKRLIVEGGVAKACEIDARGLLFFIAGFGIPNVFKNEDVRNLVRLSNPREISRALRQSQVLLKRVSDIADEMMKKGMVVEAVDLAYIFGFEDKLSPQTILTSFLQKSEEAWKKTKQASRDFPDVLKANEKYLAALKSVVNCLEGHKIDFVKLLPGWQLKDKINNLEKDVSDANRKFQDKLAPKRKVDRNNSAIKVNTPEAKRSRFTAKDPYMASPSITALQEQRIASHMDGNTSYDGSMTAHFLDGRPYSYSNYYPTASSVQIGSVSGSLPESYLGDAVAGMGNNMLGGGIAAPAMSAGIGAPTGSFSGYLGDTTIDNVGTMQHSNSHLYRWHGIGEGPLSNERLVGQSYGGQYTSTRVNDLCGRTSVDGYSGFPDHPSIGVASRSGGSDLYSFADAVFDK